MKKILNVFATLLFTAIPYIASAADAANPVVPVQSAAKPAVATPAVSAPVSAAAVAAKGAEPQKSSYAVRIGYADIARISAESNLGKASQAQAKQKYEKLQSQIQNKRKQLDKQKAAIESQLANLTPQQREAKARAFQKKVEEFQKFGMNAEKEFQKFQEELNKSYNAVFEQAAVEYGKSSNLALVVIKRELLYMGSGVEAVDASEGIIKLMNDKWVKK